MSFLLQCRSCGNQISLSRMVGDFVTCPSCGSRVGLKYFDEANPFVSPEDVAPESTPSTPGSQSEPNPYSVGQAIDQKRSRRNRMRAPGIWLTCLSSLWMVLVLFAMASSLFKFAMGIPLADELGNVNDSKLLLVRLASFSLQLVVHGIIVCGGIGMIRRENKGLAITACILASIPCCCSPFGLLGVPFGIWGLSLFEKVPFRS
ncbi:MAG: hypothetical protein AAFX06_20150 [Planctomycetota bacterium]